MDKKIIDSLEFNFVEKNDHITMHWTGKSSLLYPQQVLRPYLDSIVPFIKGKNLEIDFRKLEYMNSGTVQPLVQFIKVLSELNTIIKILYNKGSNWQNLSFNALKSISSVLKNITFEGLQD